MDNNRGIALIVVLVFSAISVAIIGALLYLLTTETKTSYMTKQYTEALEIAKGVSDYVIQRIESESLTCNGGQVCSKKGDTIDLASYVNNIGGYKIEAKLIADVVVANGKTLYMIQIKSYKPGTPEKAIVEFVYRVD